MGERTSYESGTFSWVDLSTTQPESAKSFYEALFAWTPEDMPTGNGTYSMFRKNGKDVAAASDQQEQERSQGIPPHWNNYVTVASVDESASKATELGGNAIVPPFDVLDAGRMAVAADPTGAVFSIWQPKNHIGAGLVNEPGALCWNELATNDTAKAKGFYSSLFGWSTEDFDDGSYTIVRVGDKSNGGIRPQSDQELGIPPNWLPYFAVENCDQSASKASELGANALVPPMDVPVADNSRIAVIADPQGAVFGLFSGPLDP
jgi:predicted enzyme related to lactoylglutathione lyase